MELNLCPSCNAFINASWEKCAACGAELRSPTPAPVAVEQPEPAVAYAPEPVLEPVAVPEPVVAPAPTPHDDAFTVGWAAPGNAVEPESPWAPPAYEAPATSTWADSAPTASSTTDMQPVTIQWPSPPTSSTPPVAPPSAPVEPAPTFYVDPTATPAATAGAWGAPAPAAAPAATPTTGWGNVQTSTYSYSTDAYAVGAPAFGDNRLHPLSKGKIIALAAIGPVVLVVLILLVVIGSTADTSSNDSSSFSVNPHVTAPSQASPDTGSAASDGSNWISYSDPDGHFKASLPGTPKVTTSSSKDGPIITWSATSTDGHMAAVVVAGSLPAGNYKNNQTVLQNALNGASSTSGMTVVGKTTGTDGNVLHLDALLSNSSATSNVRFFVSNNTLYGVSLTTDDANGDPEAFDTLTKSFQVLNAKKPA